MNFLKLSESIPDEESSIKFLQEPELLPSTKEYANGHKMKLVMGKQIRWRCYIKTCRKECGIRLGTWFEGSRLPFRTAILFFYSWANERTSMEYCKKGLDMNPRTTVDWCNYLREVCLFMEECCQPKIGGSGYTVEIDETLFVRRKNHCGRVI